MSTNVSFVTNFTADHDDNGPAGILIGKVKPGSDGDPPKVAWIRSNAAAAALLGFDREALLSGRGRLPPVPGARLEALCIRVAGPGSAGDATGYGEEMADGLALGATDLGGGCVIATIVRAFGRRTGGLDIPAVARELREPAQAMADRAERLAEGRAGEEAVEIHAAASRLIGLIDDLHSVGMLARDAGPRADEEFAPWTLVSDAVASLEDLAHERGVILAVRPFPAERKVVGDAGRIGRMLRRLLVEALDRAVGTVTLGIVEETGGQDPDPLLRFEIGVHGPQIRPPAVIGLAVVQRLAATLGGRAGTSNLHDGSCVAWFTVRLKQAAPAEAGGLRVLLAEDNEITRRLVTAVLQRLGHHVTAVDNGRKAVAEVAARRFDVVLMDMHMPELDGNEATRLIRALQRGGERLPVIAFTADSLPEQRARHLSSDIDAYLTKPVDWKQLDHVMRMLAARDGRTETSPLGAASS